jgi:leukocyte immunoglobulin-like receptor
MGWTRCLFLFREGRCAEWTSRYPEVIWTSLTSVTFGPQSPASQPQDYTVENLIRMVVAGLVLVVLGILLFEVLHSQRRTKCAIQV